ncbi:uncharacterized oxidoreductase SAV2478 [Aspergillus udagawae]|uniref:Uncharacterized oxidoreductase SAV2478, partial n=1 Tax=Aspergillus udagawae TaxID=91492 RepID=A0ABQ1BBU2_9EURO|nr:uncharacterized oxidoreductase SAV2478 [Aspergillus udagawae]
MPGSPFAIIAGVGPGTVSYPVVLLSRSANSFEEVVNEIKSTGREAVGVVADLTSVESTRDGFAIISRLIPDRPLAAAVFNAGTLVRKPFLDLSATEFHDAFAKNAYIYSSAKLSSNPWNNTDSSNSGAGFNFSQAVLPLLLRSRQRESHPPTLIFTGATASLKGSSRFAPFAAGKFALRAVAQSLAREFGPQGVHVVHAIIDGIIDTPATKGWNLSGEKLDPHAIAQSYWYLHTQPQTAFTFELDLRPCSEKW